MWSEFNYISVKEVLSRVLRHPLLQDVGLEEGIQYTIDFIGIMGIPNVYTDNIASIEIENYRGKLPCDLVAIGQVKYKDRCIRAMSGSFVGDKEEPAFKTKGNVIFTSFKTGKVLISYKAIQTDADGYPMLPDNPTFLKALELYIKQERFQILFDLGKITLPVLQNTQKEYAFKAGQCKNSFAIPSMSEMESITRMLNTLIPRVTEFERGFSTLGRREYLKLH